MPTRIQRRRTRGWRMPAGVVYVGRPSRWANPYRLVDHVDQPTLKAAVVALYRRYLAERPELVAVARRELAGKDVACWCRPSSAPCHGDVLLAVAAGGGPQ